MIFDETKSDDGDDDDDTDDIDIISSSSSYLSGRVCEQKLLAIASTSKIFAMSSALIIVVWRRMMNLRALSGNFCVASCHRKGYVRTQRVLSIRITCWDMRHIRSMILPLDDIF